MIPSDIRRLAVAASLCLCTIAAYGATPVTLQIIRGGTATLQNDITGADNGVQQTELDSLVDVDGTDIRGDGSAFSGGVVINRSIAKGPGKAMAVKNSTQSKSQPEITGGFDGLNLRQQRLANGGNQFTVEPPDQALCAGNGYVLESVNDVLRVYDASGIPVSGVIDLNTFYKYSVALNRSTGQYGPSITDPVCLFDKDTQRWFHVVLTLDRVGTTSKLSGGNHLDIAVSSTASPLDPWTIYRLPVQNNGTQGTPDHHCAGGFCLGDYPHIGADGNAIYLTTNEFALFGAGFYGAQIYTISKKALVAGAVNVPAVLINTADPSIPYPGFTVWPAQALSASSGSGANTEFLLSSLAVFSDDNTSNQILLWTITNTASIDEAVPRLQLSIKPITTSTYGVPPLSNQKAGSTPLRDCIANNYNDRCYAAVGAARSVNNPISPIDSSDSRMQQVFYANGKLWGALGTAVQIDGDPTVRAGIAYYVINPNAGKLEKEGTVALAGNNVIYPSIAVTDSGRGVLGFSLVGNDHYPSAAYTALDAKGGAGPIVVAQEGVGPQDGFSGYMPFSKRPRWGDYGAAATDGTSIWIANEYIGQTCSYAQYMAKPMGSCGGTRTSLANWGTRITRLIP